MYSWEPCSIDDIASREDARADHLATFNAVSFNNAINVICTRAKIV
jgi:hypothetical protein